MCKLAKTEYFAVYWIQRSINYFQLFEAAFQISYILIFILILPADFVLLLTEREVLNSPTCEFGYYSLFGSFSFCFM